MHIELASQVLLRSNSVKRESGWSEEPAFALGARRHRRSSALVPDFDQAALNPCSVFGDVSNLPVWIVDWGAAQMRLKLFCDHGELCPGWILKAYWAVSAHQETAQGGHYDTDAMRRRERRTAG